MTMEQADLKPFDQLKADGQVLVAPLLQVQVTDIASRDAAVAALQQVKAFQKSIETRRTEFVKPLQDRVKRITEYAREISEPLNAAEVHLKRQVNAWEYAERRKREEEVRRIAEERRREEEHKAEELRKARAEEERKKQEAARAAAEEAEALREAAAMLGEEPVNAPAPDAAAKAAEEQAERHAAAERARIEREGKERQAELARHERELAAQRTKGSRTVIDVEVLDLKSIPWEFLKVEPRVADLKAAYKAGKKDIPGVKFIERVDITVRAAGVRELTV